MLLANYAQQNRNTVREIGIAFTNPHAQFKAAHFLSFYTPGTAQSGRALAAFPSGYNTEAAWSQALKTGGLGANNLTGSGTFTALGQLVKEALAALTGDGGVSNAAGLKLAEMLAALTGSGDISDAQLQAFLSALADLTGSGDISDAQAAALGDLLAALSGSGDAAATVSALGELIADIVVTGTGLTTANVGDAVWSALAASNNVVGTMGEKLNDAGSAANPWTEIIESGYTAAEILRLIVAHAAGAATGLESAAPVFKSLDGTKDRISGTYSAGDRDITGLDPS